MNSELLRKCAENFGKFSGTDKIRVFTSMHQMYSKFSELLGIRMSVPDFGYYDTSQRFLDEHKCQMNE